MDLIVGYLSANASIKGICLQDYQNKEEYFFSAFMKLTCSAFNDLLKQNYQTNEEKKILTEENKREKEQCTKLTKELAALKKKQKENSCRKCIAYEEHRHEFEQKYMKMEKQFKKCAFIINSSLDGDNKIMGRVRDIFSQSVVESNNSQDCYNSSSPEERLELHKPLSNTSHPIERNDNWSLDNTSILAPSSPEGNDMETQHFGGPGEDVVFCIPETVPFDSPQLKSNTQKFFKIRDGALSPIKSMKSPSKIAMKKCVSFTKNKPVTPQKESQVDSKTLLDESIYSPPILTDFSFPSRPSTVLNPVKSPVQELCFPVKTEALCLPMAGTSHSKINYPRELSKKSGHRPLVEQQKQTPNSHRSKSLKQTKLTLTKLPSETVSATLNGVKTRMPTKTVRISPTENQETKRMRRGKGPEDWPCKDCYQLFLEAVEAKRIDVRKMPVSMNFCDVHFSRYTYYLNTPPNFWDCGIGKAPRNGHLHPLDASAANDKEDD